MVSGECSVGALQPQYPPLTIFFLEVVSTLGLCVRPADPLHLEGFHHLIQQPVDDFKPRALITPDGRCVPHVPRLPLQTEILQHNVGRLEHLDRERV